MQNYKPGTNVPLAFTLENESGVFLTPTALNWRVLDENEIVLQDWTAIETMPVTSGVTVIIPLALTALVAPATRAIRTVELEVITATGTSVLSDAIMLQGATALAVGINSFCLYGQAILVMEDYVPDNIPGWVSASRENREKALIEAYRRILLLPISAHLDNTQSMLTADTSYIRAFGPAMLRHMTATEILQLYPPMLSDLRAAQIVEAEEVLNVDLSVVARASGITSMTVGESSQFFNSSKPLDLPISRRALKKIERWVRFSAKIGRG